MRIGLRLVSCRTTEPYFWTAEPLYYGTVTLLCSKLVVDSNATVLINYVETKGIL